MRGGSCYEGPSLYCAVGTTVTDLFCSDDMGPYFNGFSLFLMLLHHLYEKSQVFVYKSSFPQCMLFWPYY